MESKRVASTILGAFLEPPSLSVAWLIGYNLNQPRSGVGLSSYHCETKGLRRFQGWQ
jgi:hypothetical protein